MEEYKFSADLRDKNIKNPGFKLRAEGYVPGVLYGPNRKSTPIKLVMKPTLKIINNPSLLKAMLDMEFKPENKTLKVLIKDFQVDPIKNRLLHIDIYEVDLKKEVDVNVPVHLVGEPVGVEKGGLLEQKLRDLDIRCLPTNIPEFIEVDVSILDIGHSLHLRDVTLPEGVITLVDGQRTVAIVSEPEAEEVAEEEELEEETEQSQSTEN